MKRCSQPGARTSCFSAERHFALDLLINQASGIVTDRGNIAEEVIFRRPCKRHHPQGYLCRVSRTNLNLAHRYQFRVGCRRKFFVSLLYPSLLTGKQAARRTDFVDQTDNRYPQPLGRTLVLERIVPGCRLKMHRIVKCPSTRL